MAAIVWHRASPLDTINMWLTCELACKCHTRCWREAALREQAKLVGDGGIPDGTACLQDVPPRRRCVGLGTIFMETIGCVQQRVCHLGGCTVGVANPAQD